MDGGCDDLIVRRASVVLLHGVQSSSRYWWRAKRDLQDLGIEVQSFDLKQLAARSLRPEPEAPRREVALPQNPASMRGSRSECLQVTEKVMHASRPGADVWLGLRASLSDFARWAQHEVAVADGVGVTVVIDDKSVFAGSNVYTESLDAMQYGIAEGPCLTAVGIGAVVRSTTIGSGESRWSRFTPRAARLALRCVASAPVRSDGWDVRVIGSLNLYGRSKDALDSLDTADVERVAAALRGRVGSARSVAVASANTQALLAAAHRRR